MSDFFETAGQCTLSGIAGLYGGMYAEDIASAMLFAGKRQRLESSLNTVNSLWEESATKCKQIYQQFYGVDDLTKYLSVKKEYDSAKNMSSMRSNSYHYLKNQLNNLNKEIIHKSRFVGLAAGLAAATLTYLGISEIMKIPGSNG